jgi:carboxyl-terminal processing protease
MLVSIFLIVPRVRQSAQSTTVGIGVAVVSVNSTFEIIAIVPGTPAANAGLRPGMVIQRINGTSVMGASLSRCIAMMRGPIGSRVQLVVFDLATRETNIVQCCRAKIVLPADNGAARFSPPAP